MKHNKILFIIFCITYTLSFQAKIYFDTKGKELTREKNVFDLCAFLDNSDDVSHTYKDKKPGAILKEMMICIEQKEALIASEILIDLLVSIANNKFQTSSGSTVPFFSK